MSEQADGRNLEGTFVVQVRRWPGFDDVRPVAVPNSGPADFEHVRRRLEQALPQDIGGLAETATDRQPPPKRRADATSLVFYDPPAGLVHFRFAGADGVADAWAAPSGAGRLDLVIREEPWHFVTPGI